MMEEHERHRYLGEPDEDLIEALEPDQLFDAVHLPVPRRRLSPATRAGLWALRIFLLVITAAVIYAFVVGVVRNA